MGSDGSGTFGELTEHITKAHELLRLGRLIQARSAFNDATLLLKHVDRPDVEYEIAAGLGRVGDALYGQGRHEEALTTRGQLIDHFGNSPQREVQSVVAAAHLGRAQSLRFIGQYDEVVAACTKATSILSDATDEKEMIVVASALREKAISLIRLHQDQSACLVITELIQRFVSQDGAPLAEIVAEAVGLRAEIYARLQHPKDAIGDYKSLIAAYGRSDDPEIKETVREARRAKRKLRWQALEASWGPSVARALERGGGTAALSEAIRKSWEKGWYGKAR